jgi:NDP-sugar pyrophosphorylase family protein
MCRLRKGFVLGAGLGTRLRPITDVLPKPLLPVFGKPLVTFAIDHLRRAGIEKIWINTHHLHQKFITLATDPIYESIELVFEPELLETGGGIKNIEAGLGNEAFIVYSGDILTDICLETLIDVHFTEQNDVTLALRTTGLSSNVAWCPGTGRVIDISGRLQSKNKFDFAGISVWSPSVFARIPEKTRISFVPIIGEWLKAGGRIGGVLLEENRWFNVGTRSEYLRLHQVIERERWSPRYIARSDWPVGVEASATMAPDCSIDGTSYVGHCCSIQDNVLIENSVLFPGSSIASGASLRSCIVGGAEVPTGMYVEKDFV